MTNESFDQLIGGLQELQGKLTDSGLYEHGISHASVYATIVGDAVERLIRMEGALTGVKADILKCADGDLYPDDTRQIALIDGALALQHEPTEQSRADDGARYRWLRDHGHGNTDRYPQAWIATGALRDGVSWVKGAEADAAVDEAMRKWPGNK